MIGAHLGIKEDQLLRLSGRQWAQDQFIDGAKGGGVGADAQGQGEDGGEREAGALTEAPKSEPEVLQQGVHTSNGATANYLKKLALRRSDRVSGCGTDVFKYAPT